MKLRPFFRSIRWRFLSWMAVLLGVCLLALDFAAYEIHLANRIGHLDEELKRRLAALSPAVVPHANPRFFGAPLPETPGQFDEGAPPPPDQGPGPDRPLPPRDEPPGPQMERPPFDAVRVATVAGQIEKEAQGGLYVVIWRGDEIEPVYRTRGLARVVFRPQTAKLDTGTYVRTRGGNREVYHVTEHGDCVLVGRTLETEQADARHFTGLLALGSMVVLALGLGGAWIIIAGALRPVEKIGAAAAKISSGDLAQRINVDETDSELGQLAAVLNAAFARLEAAFARQKQFTADAAHELRTPVSIMLTHAQNGLASVCTNDEHKEAFEACQRAAQRMKRLIAALLSLARLDDAQSADGRENFDFSEVVAEAVELLQPLARERQVAISAELAAAKVCGDAGQLGQVVTNLLTNAILYNRPGGKVEIRIEHRNAWLILTVEDTGMGIEPEDLSRVFERFFRADKSRSSGGLGLGLAISKSIVDAHGGEILATSVADRGSKFTVRLPFAG